MLMVLEFLSTPSVRRATVLPRGTLRHRVISIHALREEGDRVCHLCATSAVKFLSTPSVRRATDRPTGQALTPVISIHALREEGDLAHSHPSCDSKISIHALREEGDVAVVVGTVEKLYFYPRPP